MNISKHQYFLKTDPQIELVQSNQYFPQKSQENALQIRDTPTSSVFAILDREDPKKNEDDVKPDIIKLSNLTERGIRAIAANPGSINVVTDTNEFLTSTTVITEERNSNICFSSPSLFELYSIINVSCGAEHTIVCAFLQNEFYIFGNGSNSLGQLGLGKHVDYCERFKQVPLSNSQRFFQSVCGSFFTLLLTDTSTIWAFGHNNHGQLGADVNDTIVYQPIEVTTLKGIPITHIAAGVSHSLALSATGLIFAAGSNKQGQLGISGTFDQYSFTCVESLSQVFIVFIAANGCYSAAIDEFGTLYVWGGQWGAYPQMVNFSNKQEIFVDLALGNDGRFAALTSKGNLIVGGYYIDYDQVLTPVQIISPNLSFQRVFSGGEYFVVVTSNYEKSPLAPIYYNSGRSLLPPTPVEVKNRLRPRQRILAFHNIKISNLLKIPGLDQAINLIFSSLASLNASFLVDNFCESMSTISSGIDVTAVIAMYNQLMTNMAGIMHNLTMTFNRTILDLLKNPPMIKRPTTMRFLVIGLLHPSMFVLHDSFDYWRNLIQAIDKLNAYQVLTQWLSVLPKDELLLILNSVKDFITAECSESRRLYSDIMIKSVKTMEIIWFASNRTKKLSFEHFYHDEINQMIDVRAEYSIWQDQTARWSYARQSPWILTANTKTSFVRYCSRVMMMERQRNIMTHATQYLDDLPMVTTLDLFFILKVDRKNMVMDTFQQIAMLKDPDMDLKKPLKVVFKDEPGVDEGGLQREFFQIIVADLLNPDLNIFKPVNNEFYWFNRKATDPTSKQSLLLAGTIVGLAIYNGQLLNVRFPIVLYKKLRGMTVTFDDLNELDPQLHSSLQNILNYNGNVEDMDLLYEYDNVPLIQNGLNTPVTNQNREQYVRDVANYLLNRSIDMQFEAFKIGFLQAAGDIVMNLFRPEELSLLVAGREDYDFTALQKVTRYEGGYTADSKPVKAFWHIVNTRMTEEEKKKLLVFTTSSPRVPINGLKAIPFVIAKDGERNHIPTSHTCFFMLVLPDEPDEDKLYAKLKIAIENSEGFAFK